MISLVFMQNCISYYGQNLKIKEEVSSKVASTSGLNEFIFCLIYFVNISRLSLYTTFRIVRVQFLFGALLQFAIERNIIF